MVTELIHDLIGCEWGRVVATEDDPESCPTQAASMTVIHDGLFEARVKLCPKHKSRVLEETTPRESEDQVAVVLLECAECGMAVACLLGAEPPESCERHQEKP